MANTEDKKGSMYQQSKNNNLPIEKLRYMYDQLLHEVAKESNDPRRINLLKSQIFMLEHQCHGMSLQLNERQSNLEHAYGTLESVTLEIENWLQNSSHDSVLVPKAELSSVLKTIRGAAKRLNKPSETMETVMQRQSLNNKFSESVMCPKDIFEYNTKQMGNLEHQLSELAVSLEQFKHSLSCQPISKTNEDEVAGLIKEFSGSTFECKKVASTLSKQLGDCCHDIIQLSLLQPQSQIHRKKLYEEISLEYVVEYLKKFTKRKEVFETIPLIWQLAHHQVQVLKMRTTMLDDELQKCHERLELHTNFILDVLGGVEVMFRNFEKDSLVPLISEPISNTIDIYQLLQNEQTNENLAEFFKRFDSLIPSLQSVLKLLKGSMKVENPSQLQNALRSEIHQFTKNCLLNRKKSEGKIKEQHIISKECVKKLQSTSIETSEK